MSRIWLFLFVALASVLARVSAAVTVYTDRMAFLAAIGPTPLTETFDSTNPDTAEAPIEYNYPGLKIDVLLQAPSFSKNLYPYTIPSGDPTDVIMAGNDARDTIVFSFSRGRVFAVGAYFFCADLAGEVISPDVIVDTDQTAPMTVVTGGTTTTFLGFVSDTPFQFLSMVGDIKDFVAFASANDLIVDYEPGANEAPVVAIDGKKKIRTSKKRVIVKGTATDDSAVSEVLVSYKKVKGNGKKKKVTKRAKLAGNVWKYKLRTAAKPTKLLIQAVDDEGLRSKSQKVKVIQKS